MANQKLTIKQSELESLLAEVEQEIGQILKSESDKLVKAHPGEETSGEEEPDMSATDDSGDDSGSAPPAGDESAPAGGPPGDVSAGGPPADAGSPPVDASAPPAGDPMSDPAAGAAGDPAAESGPMDMDALAAEYAKLPPEELKMHYLAAKQAIFQMMGGGADPSADPASAGAPPMDAGSPPPASPSPSPSAPPAMKMELSSIQPSGKVSDGEDKLAAVQQSGKVSNGEDKLASVSLKGKITSKEELNWNKQPGGAVAGIGGKPNGENPLGKSEKDAEIELLKAQVEEQNKALESLVNIVGVVLSKPERKAITGISFIKKSEDQGGSEPSREQVKAKLNEVAKNPKLSKSDRLAIDKYTVGSIGYDGVKHLLTDK